MKNNVKIQSAVFIEFGFTVHYAVYCTVGKNATFRRITKYTKNTKFAAKKRKFEIFAPKKC